MMLSPDKWGTLFKLAGRARPRRDLERGGYDMQVQGGSKFWVLLHQPIANRPAANRPTHLVDAIAAPSTTIAAFNDIMAAAEQYIQLAKALPLRLQRFFARYPPASILPAGANPETTKTAYQELTPNPFSAQKHPVTGKWHDPVFSLRRQAELVKLARENGVEELLPKTVKGTEYQIAHRVEHGLRVKGTGVGQSVKGHAYERASIAKYVTSASLSFWSVLAADCIAQDGEEERGHAEDARSDAGMEEGECNTLCDSAGGMLLLTMRRSASTGGRGFRNRRLALDSLATSDRGSVYISCIINLQGGTASKSYSGPTCSARSFRRSSMASKLLELRVATCSPAELHDTFVPRIYFREQSIANLHQRRAVVKRP